MNLHRPGRRNLRRLIRTLDAKRQKAKTLPERWAIEAQIAALQPMLGKRA